MIEEALDVRFGDMTHLAALDRSSQLVQRVVLFASGPISIAARQKVGLGMLDAVYDPGAGTTARR